MLPIDSNWNWLLSSSTEFVFCKSTVDKFSDTVADRKVSEIDLTYTVWISVFSRSMRRQGFWQSRRSKVSGIQFSSPVLHRCLFVDPRSRMFRTMPLIQKWVKFTWHSPRSNLLLFQINRRQWSAHSRWSKVSDIHISVSSRKSLSFLDPWSTMFCTFWLMERRMGSPLPSTKFSSRSPTTEAPSTANIRQSSDMLQTSLSG